MSSNAARELEQYPSIKRAYLRAFARMLREREKAGWKTEWENAQQVMDWWLDH